MRILHLSDFHLDAKDREDSIKNIAEPLLNTVKLEQASKPFDLILFTGDLVNIGGKNYKDIIDGFIDCQEVLFEPLLKITHLGKDRIFFVPGNHDIVRKADHLATEMGLRSILDSSQKVYEFFDAPHGIDRIIPYKDFEKFFYLDVEIESHFSNFNSSFKVEINGKKIGIACLNSSWRCFDSNKDKQAILIGERQLTDSIEFLKGCDLYIALSHHHYDWLIPFDSENVSTLLKQNFNLFFCGHVHRVSSSYVQDPDGKLFTFCSSGILSSAIRNPERKYENGITIVDYLLDEAILKASFWKSEHLKKDFCY